MSFLNSSDALTPVGLSGPPGAPPRLPRAPPAACVAVTPLVTRSPSCLPPELDTKQADHTEERAGRYLGQRKPADTHLSSLPFSEQFRFLFSEEIAEEWG